MKSVARASLTLASLFTVPAVFAQHADLEEIVVTANPLRSSALQLAQSAIVLAGDDLARNVGPSLGETLASQPGVTASYFGPKASRPIIRGLSGERVLMLLDGVSALDVSNLSPDHSVSVEPLLADQIEILKGPTTLLYGSGAVGGVVNTVDGRIPMRKDREPIEGGLELRADTASEERSIAGRLDGAVGSVAWHLDGYSRDTDDIEIPGLDWSKALIAEKTAEGEPIEATRGYVPNTDSESDGVTAGFAWIGERSLVGFAWGRAETNYGLPGPAEHGGDDPGLTRQPSGLGSGDPFAGVEDRCRMGVAEQLGQGHGDHDGGGQAPGLGRHCLFGCGAAFDPFGERQTELREHALDAYLVLLAEHSMNASTFSARVTISTISDLYSAISTALGTLNGDAHGRANQRAMEMLLEIGSADNVENYVEESLRTKRRLMGLGHRIYKVRDPRVNFLMNYSKQLADETGDHTWHDLAQRLEQVTAQHPFFLERKLYPNVEFYSAPLLHVLGFDTDMMPAAFAMSRIGGWSAHVLEQLEDNRLIRPAARYVGPEHPTYVPIDQRG